MSYKKWIALILSFIIIACTIYTVYAAVLEVGSNNSTVSEVQSRLRQWGYYSGAVDGKYGRQTAAAVRAFQKKNGLPQTGRVDEETAVRIGVRKYINAAGQQNVPVSDQSTASQNNSDVNLLARVVYAQARGEPASGKVAVAAVVLNRVMDGRFPGSISGVIYQPGAFDCVTNGTINNTPDASCVRAANDALNGVDPSGGSIFFYNTQWAASSLLNSLKTVCTIGNLTFAQ